MAAITMLYLDHNATTPVLPAAWDAMRPLMAEAFGNPSSSHAAGRQARRHLEDAREKVAALLGALPEEVVFTSGATEANNIALFGLCGEPPGRIVASPLEHPCVTEPLKQLAARGFEIEWLKADARGVVERRELAPRVLTSLQLANHETGAIQPVRAFAELGPVHTDAAQAVGKIPVNLRGLGVTALTLSGHKFRGPKGVGALLLRKGTLLRPLQFGGHQQRGHRPGTEPVALAVGMAVALDHAVKAMSDTAASLARLRQRLLDRLRAAVPPVVVNGPLPGEADSLPTTLNLSFPSCRADLLMMSLDLAGVACSIGSACSSGSLLPSPVLIAMGVPDDVLKSAVRFSLGETTTEAEMDEAAGRIIASVNAIRAAKL
ncbi:cysteine desulfurase family protein [Limnoglobus roseus]|nr:cysteine desulfurase family protein [Limnoglobus roseus]